MKAATERAWRIWQTEADLGMFPLSSELFGIELPDLPENWATFYVPGGWPLYVRRTPQDSREVFRGDGPLTVREMLDGYPSNRIVDRRVFYTDGSLASGDYELLPEKAR